MTATLPENLDVELARVTTFEQLERTTLAAARRIAEAEGATFVLRDGDNCFYAAEDTASPLWKGQRFPLSQCLSGWAMLHRAQAIVTDIEDDDRIPVEAYRPTFVRSVVMTPLGTEDPRGAIGVYWSKAGRVLPQDKLDALMALAAQAGDAVDRLGLHLAPWAPNFALRPSG